MNQAVSYDEVLIGQSGPLGIVTLNRPKALNSLSLEMIRQISAALLRWERDKSTWAVIFRGEGGRAFCAGGDLKMFHRAGMDYRRGIVPPNVPAVFFAEEYSLNKQIFHYSKPTIAFMNGITMGGGYGIAGNCRHRIATEKTIFAMPETGIGFFPDVGSVYHLLRAPDCAGRYLALTGTQIGAGDMIHARLADFYMNSGKEAELMQKLQKGDMDMLLARLSAMSEPAPETQLLKAPAEKIDAAFGFHTIKQILEALEKDGSNWARSTVELLRQRSPASVMVTVEHLRRSEDKSFDEIIGNDFILAQRFLERMDLYEGIRAVLIEKDNAPAWDPARFEEVSDDYVRRYFEPTGYGLEAVRIFAT